MSSVDAPPRYSESSLPSYSLDPSTDEQTLEYTPRPSSRSSSHPITCSKRSGPITLILKNQHIEDDQPSYSQNTLIEGDVSLDRTSHIKQVKIKLKGRLTKSVHQCSPKTVKLLDDSYILWEEGISNESCPHSIPFTIPFPSSFQSDNRTLPLPPSYDLKVSGMEGCHVSSGYSLVVTITYNTHLMTWLKTKRLVVPVHYYPKSRPSRPTSSSSGSFSDMKILPEEWYQVLKEIKPRSSGIQSLHCNVFVPEGRVYGLSDSIPFYVQIAGPPESLRLLSPCTDSTHDLTVTVSLLRHLTVETKGVKTVHNSIIGKGQARPSPPSIFSMGENLDWEGDLHCEPDIHTVQFDVPGVMVKDYITISCSSPKSPFLPFQLVVPIRLTTESWRDIGFG